MKAIAIVLALGLVLRIPSLWMEFCRLREGRQSGMRAKLEAEREAEKLWRQWTRP